MPLNLITDSWIPAIRDREQVTLRPDQIAEEGVVRPDWPRPDLNLACLELLVGLLFLADPPRDDGDWHERYQKPDPGRLHAALEPFAPYFELTGDGPRFLQDLERFEEQANEGAVKSPDLLFIDSAGENTAKDNKDLMVKRGRYAALPLPLAAMALYTLQAFAPSGGPGYLTSMRGGGPLVTLVQPIDGDTHPLWRLVWSNVPEPERSPLSAQCAAEALPWLRPTRRWKNGEIVTPDMSHLAEAFFGMPRRLRLRFEENAVTGIVQEPHGTKYEKWRHPLSPYYRKKAGSEFLPCKAKPGKVSYRNWLGLAFGQRSGTRAVAKSVHRYHTLAIAPAAELLVGGWAVKRGQAKPMDFDLHIYPTFRLDEEAESRIGKLVESASDAALALGRAMTRVLSQSVAKKIDGNKPLTKQESGARKKIEGDAEEVFFANTEAAFVAVTERIAKGNDNRIEENWLNTLRRNALALFDQHAVPALADRNLSQIEAIVVARRNLLAAFSKQKGIRDKLELPAKDKGTAS